MVASQTLGQTIGLHDFRGVLVKFVKMLFGREFRIDPLPELRALAPFSFPFRNSLRIFLPERLEGWSDRQSAFSYYKITASLLAARHEFGTFELRLGDLPGFEGRSEEGVPALDAFAASFEDRQLASALLRLCETARLSAILVRRFRGMRSELFAVNQILTQGLKPTSFSTLLIRSALFLGPDEASLPPLSFLLKAKLAQYLAPLYTTDATIATSALCARALYGWISDLMKTREGLDSTVDDEDEDALTSGLRSDAVDEQVDSAWEMMDAFDASGDNAGSDFGADQAGGGSLQKGRDKSSGTRQSQSPSGREQSGVSDGTDEPFAGNFFWDQEQALQELKELRSQLSEVGLTGRMGQRISIVSSTGDDDTYYAYDEWDYKAGEYRRGWCRLREIRLNGDEGAFYRATLARYADLVPIVRRHFQRVRSEALRMVRGLEDGEEVDLDRSVEARVERKMRQIPNPRVYKARQKESRDVATLFLLDMSASTDEPVRSKSKPQTQSADDLDDWLRPWRDLDSRSRPKRIIDVNKEALVIMVQALEELGDQYAIMGFSGHGRYNVEFYVIKEFDWPLDEAVKARIGAIEPKRSTRMGAAIRHVREKFKNVSSRLRHVFLLSDGFPQDFDYGEDSRSYVYGVQDTMVALRELEMSGTMPFCITVDRSGHDYLRQMCRPSRYLVIDDILSLPRELPKIYEQVVRW